MPDLHHLHTDAASTLAKLIDAAYPDNETNLTIDDAHLVVDAIAEYTFALALDRLAKAGCQASAEKLAAAILTKHCETLPAPK